MSTRPYSRKYTAELSAIVSDNQVDPLTLRAVYLELLFRNRKAATELRQIIEDRLERLGTQYFPWPTTEAPTGGSGGGDGPFFQHEQGILGFKGYCVGSNGASTPERKELLRQVYEQPLPPLNSAEYMNEWGTPKTTTRLKKMAESIASFVRNAKRRNPRQFREAITEWKADLAFLKKTFYDPKYSFQWPET